VYLLPKLIFSKGDLTAGRKGKLPDLKTQLNRKFWKECECFSIPLMEEFLVGIRKFGEEVESQGRFVHVCEGLEICKIISDTVDKYAIDYDLLWLSLRSCLLILLS